MKKSGNKIILIVGITLFCLMCFFIFYFFFNPWSNKGIRYNNPSKLVKGYVESLANEDYSASIKYIYLPDNSFVNKQDFEEYIKTKKEYEKLPGMEVDSVYEETPGTFNVLLKNKYGNTSLIEIDVIERTVNDYRIDEKEIYITDYMFSVPKSTKVFIDNFEVHKEMLIRESNDEDIYLIPAIGAYEKTFKLVNKLSTNEIKVTPIVSKDIIKFKVELNDEELKNKAYTFIKNMWNDMYTGYSNKDKVSKYMKYFDEGFSESDVKEYYKTSFDKISTGLTSIGRYQNYKISSIIDNKDESTVVLSDELIEANFGYTLKWKWKFYGANSAVKMSMNRYSSLVLKVKDDSFVVYKVPDKGLFNYTSQYTRDF